MLEVEIFTNFSLYLFRYRRKAKAARPNTMVNARGGIPDQMTYSSTNLDELPENSQIARNNSIRTSPLCMQNNGMEGIY